jgi:hypothetical protein
VTMPAEPTDPRIGPPDNRYVTLPSTMKQHTQRAIWNGVPEELGVPFTLSRQTRANDRCTHALVLCSAYSQRD